MLNWSIARRLPLAIVAVALLVGAGVGISGFAIASRTAQDLTFSRLAGLAADRSALLVNALQSYELSVLTAARSETVQNAMRDLHFGWLKLGEEPASQLLSAYVTNNSFPDDRSQLDDSNLGTNYDSAHVRVHPALKVLAESAGFEDVYLFDADGNCIYSVRKGDDFAGAFGSGGTYVDTILGNLLQALPKDGQGALMSDIALYQPAGGAPSAFMAANVLDKRGAKAGSIAVRLPIMQFATLINHREGLEETGEVVIVGDDHLLRSESAFSPQADVLATSFADPVVDEALRSSSAAARVGTSYRSEPMLVDAVPVRYGALNWAVVTMIGTSEAAAPVGAMGQTMLFSAIALLVIAALAALVLSRRIARPITTLTQTMETLARGNFDTAVPHSQRADEIGAMARAVEVFRESGMKVAQLTEAEIHRTLREQEARAGMMMELQNAFGNVISAAVAGDFSRTIDATFADAELNALAGGINDLVTTVQRGLAETGAVLAALAEATSPNV